MHILLIHQAFATLDEAGGTRHHELARFLVERGHTITIITSPVSYLTGKTRSREVQWVEKDKFSGITILRTYTYPALHRSFFHRVLSFISFMLSSFLVGLGVRKVDLVWGTSPPIFQGLTAWMLARLKGIPFLFEVRDLWPAFAIAIGVLKNPLLVKASLWLETFLYRHADRVMLNSPGFLEHVSQRGAKRIELIPNGADPDMFNPQADNHTFREEHQLGGKYVILYAGAHGLSNDLGVVLNTAELLRDNPHIHFLLVGDGKEKPSLEQQANKLNLPNLTFLPPVPKNQMIIVLAAADACIAILKSLDLYKTTYPNKVFDYMAAGRPVLLAIDGVIRQVVEAAGAGIFIPPGSSTALASGIIALANDPESGRRMGNSGRLYVEQHFNRLELASQLVKIMEEMEHGYNQNRKNRP